MSLSSPPSLCAVHQNVSAAQDPVPRTVTQGAAKGSYLVRTAIWAKVCFRLSGSFSQWCSNVSMHSGNPS